MHNKVVSGLNLVYSPTSLLEGMAGSKRLMNMASELIKLPGVSVTNLVFTTNKSVERTGLNQRINIRSFHIKYLLSNPFSLIATYGKTYSVLREVYRKDTQNIFYNYGYPNVKNILIIYIARLLGYYVVFDIVEDNSEIKEFKSIASRIKVKSSLFLLKRLPYLAKGVIGISRHLVKKLEIYSKGKLKILHLPISIDGTRFENTYRHEKELPKNKIQVFYGGSYGKKDGLDYLLMAFDQLSDEYENLELVLTGKGSEKDMKRFQSQLLKIKNQNRINNCGFVSDSEYFEILLRSDIHCMTRINTKYANAGFPFKLGEMLATGKPVIASKVGDVTLYLDDKSALLVEPESIDELKSAIRYLILNKEKAIEIGLKGREVAFSNFDSKVLSGMLYEFLINI